MSHAGARGNFWQRQASAGAASSRAAVHESSEERLELKSDRSYAQDIVLQSRHLQHNGERRVISRFFGGSKVAVRNAAIISHATARGNDAEIGFGDLTMYVHNRSGKIALARKEVADWYCGRLR
jgi:hypothetical protein